MSFARENHKKKTTRLFLPLGLTSLALLLFAFSTYLTHSFLYPTAPLSAIANGSEIGLNIKDFIKVAVDTDNLALHDTSGDTAVTPEPSGTLVYGDVNVAVTTNTVRGYSLSVYTQDSSNSMRHQNSTVTDAIAPISSISGYNATTGASDLAGNTWGFRRNTGTIESPTYTNWFAVGENANNNTIIYDTDTGNSAFCENLSYPLSSTGCDSGTYDTFNINFGAKLTSSLPAGTYTNNVVFSAVAKDEGARYTLDFHPNGGENVMANRTIIKGSTAVLPTNGFSLPGHAIKCWALTQADAEAASTTTSHPTPTSPTYSTYTAGQTVSVNDLITAAIAAGQSVEQNALINLYAIWDIAYTVTYNAGSNGSNIATGSAITNDTILSATITIPGNENDHFALEGYNFLGWALTNGATTTAYVSGDTPTMSSLITAAATAGQSVTNTASGTINLYAVWEEDIVWMQSFDCNTRLPNIGDSLVAVDNRDNHEYHVKKLSDGNCWMIDNLTISATGMVADSLDNTNTNIPSSDTNKYYLPPQGKSYQIVDSITNSAVKSATASVDFGTSSSNYQTYSRYPQVGYRAQGTTNNNNNAAMPESTAYYNFYTASLGFSYYQDGKTSGSSPRDICPKGWRLPWVSDSGSTSTGTGDMYTLALSYNNDSNVWSSYITPGSSSSNNPYTSNTAVRQNMVAGDSGSLDRFASNGAAGFTYAGYYGGTTLYYVGTNGFYWSSSVYSTYNSYFLGFDTTDVYPQNHPLKYFGFAVRCIAGTRS